MSSNVIQTIDEKGKFKWQNLDSAFGGKYEDLLTLGKGEVKVGAPIEQPYLEVFIPADATTFTLAGSVGVMLLTAANTADCIVDISGLATPAGSMVVVLTKSSGSTAEVKFNGKGLNEFVVMGPGDESYYFLFGKSDGTVAIR